MLRKRTMDDVPALFQLSTLLTLVVVLGHEAVAQPPVGAGQGAAFWSLLLANLVLGRAIARRVSTAAVPAERVMVVGEAEAADGCAPSWPAPDRASRRSRSSPTFRSSSAARTTAAPCPTPRCRRSSPARASTA